MLLNTGFPNLSIQKINCFQPLLIVLIIKVTYGLEGSIFSAGVIVKWLRDTLKLISTAAETETLTKKHTVCPAQMVCILFLLLPDWA